MATSIKHQQLLFAAAGVKEMRYKSVFQFLSVRKFDTLDMFYKEAPDRTTFGPIQVTAVYCMGDVKNFGTVWCLKTT
jgi:hypothetical protein